MDAPDSDLDMDDSDVRSVMAFPVTASMGPAGPLLRQLRSLTTVPNVASEDEIQRLTKDLDGLCISLMHQSEAEEPLSSTAKSWMNEVRELCYDTKSYLDDAPFISKQDDDDDDAQLTPQEKQENAHFEFKMLEARANNASRRSKRYGIDHKSINNKTKLPSTGRRLPVLHPELIDRHRMDNLASLLGNGEGEPLKIVSLVGLEGVGKTTIAKRVYHQLQTGERFHCRAFVRVSRNPDMRRLLTTIFTQIQLPDFSSSEGVSQPSCCLDAQALIANIKNYLQDKRYLIIIDDLWTTSVWDIIRRAFPDDGCHSRIVITTQFEDVASACCSYQSKYKFEMEPLKYDQSRKLFFSIVFGSEDEISFHEGFREVSSEIIEKCDGLPLSMVNITSLLPTPSKLNLQQWKDIRDSLPPTLKTNPSSEGMEKVINLIYNNLSPEVKTCLLHLVVYPEGYTSNKDDLVKQWVTEGFTGEGQNNEEIARDCFDELVSTGMIQAVDMNYQGVQSCTLHHMVHDFIVKKSMERNFIIAVDNFQSAILLPSKVRRLSIQFGGARNARIPAGITLSEVQSLAFFGFCGCTDFIGECKLLRVLILHVWDDQDKVAFDLSGIITLLPLRYVKIACNIAIKLPDKIQDLQYLETLEVDATVVAIPSGIRKLSRLSSLKIAVSAISRNDICILRALPALSNLSLHVWTTPIELIIFDKEEFLVLKSFEFRCPVPSLKFETGSMPDLRNLDLCFNAREADQHDIVPIGMEHLAGLEVITAHIWGSHTDVGSTFRTAISNHPSNPRIYMRLVHPIFHGDATTSVGTIKVKDEKKQAADTRMSTLPRSKRMSTLLGSSSSVPVQGADKKLKVEIKTDGIEVKAETFAYGRENMAHRMSKLKMETEIFDDMDIEHWMPSSPMNNRTHMNWQPAGWEDEKKPADIRMYASPCSSSRVPNSGAYKRSKLKTETDNNVIMEETDFDCVDDKVILEPWMTTGGEFVKLFQWMRSAISSQYSGSSVPREPEIQGEVLKLDEHLQGLRDTLPEMYDLINAAEWRSYEDSIAEILPNLWNAVYDAEDLLDEFNWYELKVTVDGNANQCPFSDFFNDVITGSFNEKVQCIQDRLDNLLNQLEKIGFHEDSYESVRPKTNYLPNESEIFGRAKELKKVIQFLTKPTKSSGARSKNMSANKDNDESKIAGLHVLPIVGIGGVGKTCLAQHVCNDEEIGNQFNLIIWICVSGDFDVIRLTKEAIESCSGERPTTDHLGTLQHALSEHVRDKKLLIILDDLWGDAFKEHSKNWNIFCAPLKNIGQKSLMLVTTRSPTVAHRVCTMRPFTLHGLKDEAFWNFFKQCIFGSDQSSNNDPNLERIGMSILPKLKGSPLAAKSVGLMLRKDLRASHWNYVLGSELWELKQEKTDILPSLQLSYMYLPPHLKRCFAFCAVYPKNYRFKKHCLAEIWVAEGFVEPEGDITATDISCRYFEELVNESFFQEISGSYIIPHLLHDMAQLVSRNDCFIIREKADFGKVPPNVRHLSILSRKGLDKADLLSLCKHTKLRTLLFDQLLGSKSISAVIDHWCRGLHGLRVMCCGSTNELPDSIGSLKHLRYLEISQACPFNSLPSAFFYLYSLQTIYAKECKLETMCGDFSKLISLRRFKSHGFDYSPGCVLDIDLADWQGLGLGLIKNVSDVKGLCFRNLCKISKNQAAEVELKNKQHLNSLKLSWDYWYPGEKGNDDREVLQALEPPTCLKSLHLQGYGGVSLPSWFGPQNLPSLTSLTLDRCDELDSMFLPEGTSLSRVSQRIHDQNKMPVELLVHSNKDTTGIFLSLTELNISRCQRLSSLEQLVQPAYIPAIKKITIKACKNLVSAGSFVGFRCLEELVVDECPKIYSQCLVARSLKRLVLGCSSIDDRIGTSYGNLADNIECCSLTGFTLTGNGLTSIRQQNWNVPALQELDIVGCKFLRSIGQSVPTLLNPFVCGGTGSSTRGRFSSLTSLSIFSCEELSVIDNLLSEDYLPVIEKIELTACKKLVSLPVEIGSLSSLRQLEITGCPSIRWPSGLVFPSSLECLDLNDSGDMSACVPSCLENLTSLVSLMLGKCPSITVIPESVWSNIRKSLQQLCITECPDLVSIGGARAIRKLRALTIEKCPKMEDIKQPQKRGRFNPWEGKSI
ncbi:hypothetical protein ACQJBY_030635 [Aegilops geniculata]